MGRHDPVEREKEEYREIKPYYEKRFSNCFMGENKLLVGGKRLT